LGFEVHSEIFEDITDSIQADLIFINSVIEHPHSLDFFFNKLANSLTPKGVVSLFDMHSNGLDIMLLKEHAQNVNPLLILQIGSVQGIRELSSRHNMEVIEAYSGGRLDSEIIYEFCQSLDRDHPLYGMSVLLSSKDARMQFQDFLTANLKTGYNGYVIKKK